MVPKDWIYDFLEEEDKAKGKSKPKSKRRSTTPPVKKEREYEQDESLEILNDLKNEGYDTVELISPHSACDKCKPNAGEKELASWLNELVFSAPIFEWTHPGCNSCYLVVKDSTGELPPQVVNRDGTAEPMDEE